MCPWRAVHPCNRDQKLTLTVWKTCINGSNFVHDALFQPSDNMRFVYIHFVFQASPKNVVAPRNIRRFGWLGGNIIKMCNNVFWKCDSVTILWFICCVVCGTVWLKPESIIISNSINLWCQQHYLLSCWCNGYCTAAFITELQPSNSRSWHRTADHDIQTGYFPNTCWSLLYQQFCLFTYLEVGGVPCQT